LDLVLFWRTAETYDSRHHQRRRNGSYSRSRPPRSLALRSCVLLPKFHEQHLLYRRRRKPLAFIHHDRRHNRA
jgi:hypothetical protein